MRIKKINYSLFKDSRITYIYITLKKCTQKLIGLRKIIDKITRFMSVHKYEFRIYVMKIKLSAL